MAKLFQNCVLEVRQLHIGNILNHNRGTATAHIMENISTFDIGVKEIRV